MRTSLCIMIASFVIAVPMVHSCHAQSVASPYLQAVVVSVQKHQVRSPGDTLTTPTDAPLSSRLYTYDVSVRIGCNTYVARYQSAFDYLSSAFTVGSPIAVRMSKHVINFEVPNDAELRMAIVRHARESDAACAANRQLRPGFSPHESART